MTLSVKTSLISFDQGLNTYGNPHRQNNGVILSANGVGLDKDGYIYPANQLCQYSINGASVGTERYNGGAYTAAASAPNDVLLAHTASSNRSPALNIATGGNSGLSSPVFPFYQSTQTVFGSQTYNTNSTQTSHGASCSAIVGNFVCYAWLTLTGVVMFGREDLTTGERESPFYLGSTGPKNQWSTGISAGYTKVAVSPQYDTSGNTNGFNVFALGTSGTVTRVGVAGPLGANFFTINTLSGGTFYYNMDVCYDSTQCHVILNDNNTQIVGYRSGNNYAFTTLITGLTLSATNTCVSSGASNLFETPAGILVAYSNAAGATTLANFTTTFSSGFSATIPTNNPKQIGMSISNGSYFFAVENANTFTSNGKSVTWNQVNTATGILGTAFSAYSGLFQSAGGVALLGKPWVNSLGLGDTLGNHALFPVRTGWHYSNGGSASSQISYPNAYLLDLNGNVCAKWADRDMGSPNVWPAFDSAGYTPNALPLLQMPAQAGVTNAVFSWPQLSYTEGSSGAIATLGQPINSNCSISKAYFSSQTANTNKLVQLGSMLVAPTTVTSIHDGVLTTEAGYFTSCPQPICALASGGNLTVAGSYFYVGVMQYVDGSGRFHFSAPSLPTLAPSPSSGNQTINITYPIHFLSLRNANTNNIRFLTYRTQSGGGSGTTTGAAYYLVDSSLSNVVAIPAASGNPFTATASDGKSDATILSAPKIYTSSFSAGASAGTASPPPFFSTCVWQNCVWGAAYRNGWELWFSWPLDNSVFEPEGIAWSSVNRISVPADVGQVQGISGLDGNLIILGTNRDYVITGQPPSRASSQLDSSTFSPVAQLPTPSGMRVRNGVATVPQGLVFQGTTGMMVLDRSLQYRDIGNTITDIASNTVYGAGVLFSQNNCMIFPPISGSGPPLSWYYEDGRWSVPQQTATGLSNWNQVVTLNPFRVNNVITNVGLTRFSAPPLIQLSGFGTYLQAQTQWFEMDATSNVNTVIPNVAGYGRLFEVQVQGDLRTDIAFPYALTLQTEYDYVNNLNTPPDVQTITVADSSKQSPGPADLAWRFGFSTGQAKRVRFTLTFDATAGFYTLPLTSALVAFSGLMLYYGVDSGLARTGPGVSSPSGS